MIAYHLLSTGQPYADLGADSFVDRLSRQAYERRLVSQLEKLGKKVTLEPADVA